VKPSRAHPAARRELRAAIARDETEYPGRGIRLLHAVEAVVRRVENVPQSAPIWAGVTSKFEIRGAKVRRHPYIVVYAIHPDHLVLVAVAHTSRFPGYWASRVDDYVPKSGKRK